MPSLSRSILVLIAVLTAGEASAYIDPGTGSAVVQGLIALVAGVFATAALWGAWVRRLLSRKARKARQTAAREPSEEGTHAPS